MNESKAVGIVAQYAKHEGPVYCVSPDHILPRLLNAGTVDNVPLSQALPVHVVSGDGDDCARLWAVVTCEKCLESGCLELAILSGHTDTVVRAGFSADNRLFFTASMDGTVRVYRLTPGESTVDSRVQIKCDHCSFDGGAPYVLPQLELLGVCQGPASDITCCVWHPYLPVIVAGEAEGSVWVWAVKATAKGVPIQCTIVRNTSPDDKRGSNEGKRDEPSSEQSQKPVWERKKHIPSPPSTEREKNNVSVLYVLVGHSGAVCELAFVGSSGRFVASCDFGVPSEYGAVGQLILWDIRKGKMYHKIDSRSITQTATLRRLLVKEHLLGKTSLIQDRSDRDGPVGGRYAYLRETPVDAPFVSLTAVSAHPLSFLRSPTYRAVVRKELNKSGDSEQKYEHVGSGELVACGTADGKAYIVQADAKKVMCMVDTEVPNTEEKQTSDKTGNSQHDDTSQGKEDDGDGEGEEAGASVESLSFSVYDASSPLVLNNILQVLTALAVHTGEKAQKHAQSSDGSSIANGSAMVTAIKLMAQWTSVVRTELAACAVGNTGNAKSGTRGGKPAGAGKGKRPLVNIPRRRPAVRPGNKRETTTTTTTTTTPAQSSNTRRSTVAAVPMLAVGGLNGVLATVDVRQLILRAAVSVPGPELVAPGGDSEQDSKGQDGEDSSENPKTVQGPPAGFTKCVFNTAPDLTRKWLPEDLLPIRSLLSENGAKKTETKEGNDTEGTNDDGKPSTETKVVGLKYDASYPNAVVGLDTAGRITVMDGLTGKLVCPPAFIHSECIMTGSLCVAVSQFRLPDAQNLDKFEWKMVVSKTVATGSDDSLVQMVLV